MNAFILFTLLQFLQHFKITLIVTESDHFHYTHVPLKLHAAYQNNSHCDRQQLLSFYSRSSETAAYQNNSHCYKNNNNYFHFTHAPLKLQHIKITLIVTESNTAYKNNSHCDRHQLLSFYSRSSETAAYQNNSHCDRKQYSI